MPVTNKDRKMKVYRYYEPHITGGLSRVQVNERQIVNYMRTQERFQNRVTDEMTDEDVIAIFVMEFKAREDFNPPQSLLVPPMHSKDIPNSFDDFIFVRSHGSTPKEAFDNAKECAEFNDEFGFVLNYSRYYVISGLNSMRELITSDEDINIVLSEIKISRTRPRTLFMLPLRNDEFLLFAPKKVIYEC